MLRCWRTLLGGAAGTLLLHSAPSAAPSFRRRLLSRRAAAAAQRASTRCHPPSMPLADRLRSSMLPSARQGKPPGSGGMATGQLMVLARRYTPFPHATPRTLLQHAAYHYLPLRANIMVRCLRGLWFFSLYYSSSHATVAPRAGGEEGYSSPLPATRWRAAARPCRSRKNALLPLLLVLFFHTTMAFLIAFLSAHGAPTTTPPPLHAAAPSGSVLCGLVLHAAPLPAERRCHAGSGSQFYWFSALPGFYLHSGSVLYGSLPAPICALVKHGFCTLTFCTTFPRLYTTPTTTLRCCHLFAHTTAHLRWRLNAALPLPSSSRIVYTAALHHQCYQFCTPTGSHKHRHIGFGSAAVGYHYPHASHRARPVLRRSGCGHAGRTPSARVARLPGFCAGWVHFTRFKTTTPACYLPARGAYKRLPPAAYRHGVRRLSLPHFPLPYTRLRSYTAAW